MILSKEQQALLEAQAAVRARDELLAIVSHDLRSPLMGIACLVELLKKRLSYDAKACHYLHSIGKSTDAMSRLIDDLLDISRAESGKLSLRLVPTSLVALWEDAIDRLSSAGQCKNISIEFLDLPKKSIMMYIDKDRVIQALSNVVSNAVKFIPPGGSVMLGVQQTGNNIKIDVYDTGPGIETNQLERLFEPFWQGRKNDLRGLGLGLHIVKAIVEAHNGNVYIQNKPPYGCLVSILLPVGVSLHG